MTLELKGQFEVRRAGSHFIFLAIFPLKFPCIYKYAFSDLKECLNKKKFQKKPSFKFNFTLKNIRPWQKILGTLSDYVEFSPSPNLECSEQGNVVHHLLLLVVHHLHDHLFSHEFEHLFRPPFIVNKRISPVNICYHLCIVHLVDNLLLLLVVKRLCGHRINNFLDYLSRVTHLHHHVSQLFGQVLRPVL